MEAAAQLQEFLTSEAVKQHRGFGDVADPLLHLHGALGVSNEMPFVKMLVQAESMGIADGPTEVHKITMARQILKRYAPGVLLRLHVELDKVESPPASAGQPGSDRRNPFRWSSSSGPTQPLKTGTMCQAAIVVERRRLISLIVPWTKKLVGAD